MLKGSWLVGRVCHRKLAAFVGAAGILPLTLVLACGDDQSGTGKVRENPGLNTESKDGGTNSRDGAADGLVSESGETNTSVETSSTGNHSWTTTTAAATTTVGVMPTETTSQSPNSAPSWTTTTMMTTSAPDSWEDIEPPFPGLSDCGERSTGTDDACLYELRCSTRSYDSRCAKLDDGTWNCSCLDWSRNRTAKYVLDGADADSACRVGLPFCVAGEEPEISEPECAIREQETSESFCSRSNLCLSSAQLGAGIVAHFEDEKRINACSDYGDAMACQCDGGYRRHDVYGADGTRACDLLLGVCDGVIPVGEEQVCDDASLYVSQDHCSFSQSCGARTELDPDTGVYALMRLGTMSAHCGSYGGIQSCSCTDRSFTIEVEGSSLGDACRTSGSVCSARTTLEASEPADCIDVTTIASGPTCTMSARCSVTAASNESTLKVYAHLGAGCRKSGDEWSCSCSSGTNDGDAFTLVGSDGLDVCTQASASCSRTVQQLEFDSYGEPQFVFGVPWPVELDAGAP